MFGNLTRYIALTQFLSQGTVSLSAAPKKLAFQGVPGAYSHLACQNFYPQATALPFASFDDAMAAVESGAVDGALIPIENSTAGRVAGVHLLLHSNGLSIYAEHFLAVRHQLLGLANSQLADLQQVFSHPQGLAQCHGFLREHQLKPQAHADTAGAAEDVARWQDPTKAAIASTLAADIYGLKILAKDIQDEDHNTTRFVLLQPNHLPHPIIEQPTITSLFFRVRNLPAALFKALGGFATNGINLLKIESFLEDGQFVSALFYLEALADPATPAMQLALEELAFFSDRITHLGHYPAAPERSL